MSQQIKQSSWRTRNALEQETEMQSITIEHGKNSSLQGQRQVFNKTRVRGGRLPSNDIRFDPAQDRLVSGEHVEFEIRDNKLIVRDLGSRNGTWIQGHRIQEDHVLRPGETVRLGSAGPEMTAKLALPASATRMLDSPPAQMGQRTLMSFIDKRVKKERNRVGRFAAAGVATILVAFGFLWINRDGPTRVRVEKADISVLAGDLQQAVFMVTTQHKTDGTWIDDDGGGTAWNVGDGLLATNAHVAESFPEESDGQRRLIARRLEGDKIIEVVIRSVEIHPGYALNEPVRKVRPYIAGSGFFETLPAFDVALLKVRSDQVEDLGRPLELASQDEVENIAIGEELATSGFPAETVTGGGGEKARPLPQFRTGRLSKAQDFLLRPAAPALRMLLTISHGSSGGASGSPYVNADGRVVALLNSGDVLGMTAKGRINGNNTYGQRVDCLRELLDGTAAKKTESRKKELETWLETKWQDGRSSLVDAFQLAWNDALKEKGLKIVLVDSEDISIKAGAVMEYSRDVTPSAYQYLILAKSRPVPVQAELDRGSRTEDDVLEATSHWSLRALLPRKGGGRTAFRMRVQSETTEVVEVFCFKTVPV